MSQIHPKISVLVATGIYPPKIGGPATYAKMLSDELPKLGFGVEIVSFDEVRKYPKGVSHLLYFFMLLKRGYHADVMYALDPVSVGLPAYFAANFLHKKFMLRIVGDYAWEMLSLKIGTTLSPEEFAETKPPSGFYIRFLCAVQSFVGNQADKIITPSKYIEHVIRMWGVESGKIVVIHNNAHDVTNIAQKEVLRKMMSIHEDDDVILSAGRLIPLKGIDLVIRAMPKILKIYPKVKYIIAGEGPEQAKLEEIVKELSLEDKVIMTGSLDKETLYRYIRVADVFVLNSMYETFPNILVEVMSIGTSVVATNVGGVPEIIDSEVDGILVPFGDEVKLIHAIDRLLGEEKMSLKLTQNAFKKTDKFKKEIILKETTQEIQSLF